MDKQDETWACTIKLFTVVIVAVSYFLFFNYGILGSKINWTLSKKLNSNFNFKMFRQMFSTASISATNGENFIKTTLFFIVIVFVVNTHFHRNLIISKNTRN